VLLVLLARRVCSLFAAHLEMATPAGAESPALNPWMHGNVGWNRMFAMLPALDNQSPQELAAC